MKSFQEITKSFAKLDKKFSEENIKFYRTQHIKDAFGITTSLAKTILMFSSKFGLVYPRYLVKCPTCGTTVKRLKFKPLSSDKFHCDATDECDDLEPFHASDKLVELVYWRENV